jgi:chemotaxis protein histidine kinase CheA
MDTMRARAGAEGGRLDVESTPGRGTTLTLSMPINASIGMPVAADGSWPAIGPDHVQCADRPS